MRRVSLPAALVLALLALLCLCAAPARAEHADELHSEEVDLHAEDVDLSVEQAPEFEYVTQFVETESSSERRPRGRRAARQAAAMRAARAPKLVSPILDNTGSATFTPKADLTKFKVRAVIDPNFGGLDSELQQEPEDPFAKFQAAQQAALAAAAGQPIPAPAPVTATATVFKAPGSAPVAADATAAPATPTAPQTDASAALGLSAEFEEWMLRFGRVYASADEALRRQAIWVANGARAADLTSRSGGAQFSNEGPHADLEQAEYAAMLDDYASVDPRAQSLLQSAEQTAFESDLVFLETAMGTPARQMSVDWRSLSTPVKNQLQCGGSWALTAASVLESAAAKAGRPLATYSAQQLLDCNNAGQKACQGGSALSALAYWKNHRSTSAQSYPYANAPTGACRMASGNGPRVATTGLVGPACTQGDCAAQNEEDVIQALAQHGPLAVMVDATQWQLYQGGVLSAQSGCSSRGESLNHAATLVGYSPQGYWLVRGTFGQSWGNSGYAKVAFGSNACGIANFVAFATV